MNTMISLKVNYTFVSLLETTVECAAYVILSIYS